MCLQNLTNCSALAGTWERVNQTVCTGVPYTGSQCTSQLKLWQQCASQTASVSSGAVMVINRNDSMIVDSLLTQLRSIAGQISMHFSSVCSQYYYYKTLHCFLFLQTLSLDSVVPFICQYAFPVCEQSTGVLMLPDCSRLPYVHRKYYDQLLLSIIIIRWKSMYENMHKHSCNCFSSE